MTDLTVSLALLGEPRNLTAEALEMSTSPSPEGHSADCDSN